MFSIKVDNLDPFLDAISLFTELINDEICLKFSPSTFSIIARYQCPPFFAMMFMPHPLFAEYSVDRNHMSRISLRNFRNALLEGQSYSSMSIHIQEPQNTILLKFEPSRPTALPLHHELTFLPMEDWSLNQVSLNGKFFAIESEMFSNMLTTFSVYNEVDTIFITSKGSQFTFSVVPFEEIIIREESGDCLVIGDREVETHMHMPLHPSSFFINCGLQARRVWFMATTDSCAIIHFPFEVYAHFLMVCFPFANVNSPQD